ncbi:MAG: hypothetical protein HN769_03475 [Anaerolineae bacterium]|jgi:hypothetical protein|nr:hypothetical protein [Anaerolineae bacterium]
MSVMILDAGNSIIKAKIANGEIAFPHAIQPLTEGEYQKVTSRASINGTSADYFRVNGKPSVVGESAERHSVLVQRSGSSRYTRDYYGCTSSKLVHLYNPSNLDGYRGENRLNFKNLVIY